MATFSATVDAALRTALAYANARSHEFATLEHLLLALIDEPDASKVLRACNVNLTRLRQTLIGYLDRELHSPVARMDGIEASATDAFTRVIKRAIAHVDNANKPEVTGADLLIAIFNERDSHARYFLQEQDMTRYDAVNYVSHKIAKNPAFRGNNPVRSGGVDPSEIDEIPASDDSAGQEEAETSEIEKFCVNLNQRARDGDLDPLIGRNHEIERCVQVLCRRRKNNPILVGDSGVGKTAIAEGLAFRIVAGEIPSVLAESTVYSLDMGAVLAGTRYRGDFEQRMKTVISELEKHPDAILFIDEIHTVIGAGATSGGSMDASNLLKPPLQSGRLRCIGSTTYKEYRQHFEKDRALTRRFQKIDVNEPSTEDTIDILMGLRASFESHHGVRYTADAIKTAVDLSARHIHDRKLPDKAIDVIDEAGARQQILPRKRKRKTVGVKEIETAVAKLARIPPKRVSKNDSELLADLEETLKRTVYGQDVAIEALASAIKLSRSGLREPEKPVGNYLFTGPTGVGKTEVARRLAEALSVTLHRFDMSEYMERHAVSRLIGAPPGYVGFDQGGLLTDSVDQHPHCVLLLDEFEKAHPDVYNILLQVMDYGKLTDHNGRTVNFGNAIIIMTSNAGAAELEKTAIGFGRDSRKGEDTAAVERIFSPEFRNRLDAIISFNPLSRPVILKVVEKFIHQLEAQLMDRNVEVILSEPAAEWLAEHGYDSKMGARPLARLIQEKIKKPLADELLFGKLAKGGVVSVDVKDGELAIECEPPPNRQLSKGKAPLLISE